MTRDYYKQPISTADALAPRKCRCDVAMGNKSTCFKCGHALPPDPDPALEPKRLPGLGPFELRVDPSWEQMARVLEGER